MLRLTKVTKSMAAVRKYRFCVKLLGSLFNMSRHFCFLRGEKKIRQMGTSFTAFPICTTCVLVSNRRHFVFFVLVIKTSMLFVIDVTFDIVAVFLLEFFDHLLCSFLSSPQADHVLHLSAPSVA